MVRKRLGDDKYIHAWGPSVTAIKLIARCPGLLNSWDSSMWYPIRAMRSEILGVMPFAFRKWDGRRFVPIKGKRLEGITREEALEFNAKEWLKFLEWLDALMRKQRKITSSWPWVVG